MLSIDGEGMVLNPRIKRARSRGIEQRDMHAIHGIIVHQTGGPTAQSTFNSYKNPAANGAHFLIDKDGTIYQTASLKKQTYHVGPLKARCVLEKRCTPTEIKLLQTHNPTAEGRREIKKKVPERFPSNRDSVGIEIVGEALPRGNNIPDKMKVYEAISNEQNSSLAWLVSELTLTLKISMREIFRHPDVSRKHETEARTAKW
ncbi:peptidoglycan recognition protein family protein [Collimonas antrihumi]|uniref:peptidoglycan recognition protein family protein n=1 Tax=Collimonas antrihumi TaxID=1940615 RepID=UPI001B8AD164|nr:peptidoglycan recognition family protein [Collimonas antrihumi]